jgi:hypothetical protein
MIHIELPLSKSQVNRALIAVAAKGNLLPWLSEHPEIAAQGCRDTRLMAEALHTTHHNLWQQQFTKSSDIALGGCVDNHGCPNNLFE